MIRSFLFQIIVLSVIIVPIAPATITTVTTIIIMHPHPQSAVSSP
jgi:hypothetical protein